METVAAGNRIAMIGPHGDTKTDLEEFKRVLKDPQWVSQRRAVLDELRSLLNDKVQELETAADTSLRIPVSLSDYMLIDTGTVTVSIFDPKMNVLFDIPAADVLALASTLTRAFAVYAVLQDRQKASLSGVDPALGVDGPVADGQGQGT